MRRPTARTMLGVLGGTDEDAGGRRDVGPELRLDRGHVLGRQPVEDHAVGLTAGEPQHAGSEGGEKDRWRMLDRPGQSESPHV